MKARPGDLTVTTASIVTTIDELQIAVEPLAKGGWQARATSICVRAYADSSWRDVGECHRQAKCRHSLQHRHDGVVCKSNA